MRYFVRLFAILLLVLVSVFQAFAGDSWEVVQGLRAGDRVIVQEKSGPAHKGAVAAVTPDALSLATGKQQVSIDRNRVQRVQLHSESRRARNIAIGAGIGVALGATVDQTLGAYLRNETGDSGRAVTYLAPVGLFGGIGALLAPYRTVYRAK